MSIRAVRWAGFAAVGVGLLWVSGCKVASVDATSTYACDDGTCPRTGYFCWSDHRCHLGPQGPGDSDAGLSDGGVADGGVTDGGMTDGGVTDGGVQLGAVRLRSPANGAYTGSPAQNSNAWRSIALEWWPVDGGSHFQVAYAGCSAPGNCAFDPESVEPADAGASTRYWLSGLEDNSGSPPIEQRYHWAVRACPATGDCGPWSRTRYFDVGHPGRPVSNDLDGDGTSDLVWGLPQSSGGVTGGGAGVGVRFGDGDAGFIPSNDSAFGHSIVTLGDLEGNGQWSFFVGQVERWQGDAGLIYPVHANGQNVSIETGTFLQRFHGFGGLGDTNGDGYSDYFVVSDAGFIVSNGASVALPSSAGAVQPVLRAGDFDGDGYDDFIVFSRDVSKFQMYPGAEAWGLRSVSGLPRTHDAAFVCGAGDVNGDGYADVVYQPPGAPLNELLGAPVPTLSTVPGAPANGRDCEKAGDINDDGFADVLLLQADAGVQILLGSETGLEGPGVVLNASLAVSSGGFGARAFGVGDTNGDGFADVVVEYGAPSDPGTCQSFVLYQSDGGMLSGNGGQPVTPPDGGSAHSDCSMAAAP